MRRHLPLPLSRPRPAPSALSAVFGLLLAAAFLQMPARADDAEALTGTARMLAGLQPSTPTTAQERITQTEAWKAHRRTSEAGIKKLRTRLAAMDGWQSSHLAPLAPESRTLIYPFSGPDFVNAYALFPNEDSYVLFSLEEPGAVPALDRLPEAELGDLLGDLRVALNDIVHLNFFITPNMKEQVRESSLKGTVPVLMAMMGMLELRVLRVESIDLWPERSAFIREQPKAKRPKLPMRAVQIDFTHPATPNRVQSLYYFSFDVSDSALVHYPEFLPWLRDYRQPTVLLKSASYLLHGHGFKQMREFVLDRSALLVQDDTGVPYRLLSPAGLAVDLYGRYETPVELFKTRHQDDLAAAFKMRARAETVPFPFGYNWRKGGKSFVIVARRDGNVTTASKAGS